MISYNYYKQLSDAETLLSFKYISNMINCCCTKKTTLEKIFYEQHDLRLTSTLLCRKKWV